MGLPSRPEANLRHNLQNKASSDAAIDSLPPLPFSPHALESYIGTATMQIHDDKHHQAYVTKPSTALSQKPALRGKSLVSTPNFTFCLQHLLAAVPQYIPP